VMPAGAAGIDHFVLAIFAWGVLGFAAVYDSLARRAFDMVVETVKHKTSLALARSMAYHAEVQHAVAEIMIELESTGPHLGKITRDWSTGVDYGPAWGAKIVAAKYRVVEGVWRVVDLALIVASRRACELETAVLARAGNGMPRPPALPWTMASERVGTVTKLLLLFIIYL
jgi:alkylation response protein AidB-like acyl-CoA dehydrogenase